MGKWAGWPRVIAHLGLPQIRTCGITASGSSSNSFASMTAHRMDGCRVDEGVALLKSGEPGPRQPIPALAAAKPFPPQTPHLLPKSLQRNVVARDPVVSVVSAEFLIQCLVLLRNRAVSVEPAPLGNRPDCPRKSARGRFALHHPVPLPGSCPIMGESQQVERSRRRPRRLIPRRFPQRWSPKRHPSGLLGMNRQAVLAETFRQHV